MVTSEQLFNAWLQKDWDTYNKLVSQLPFSDAVNVSDESVEIRLSSQKTPPAAEDSTPS